MCEVDVFEHPRFCDEFSHLVKEVLLQLKFSVEVSRRGIDVLADFNIFLNCHIYHGVVNNR